MKMKSNGLNILLIVRKKKRTLLIMHISQENILYKLVKNLLFVHLTKVKLIRHFLLGWKEKEN